MMIREPLAMHCRRHASCGRTWNAAPIGLAALLLLCAGASFAQNDGRNLVNRRFDNGLAAWDALNTTSRLDALDAANRTGSMSVRLADDTPGDNGGFATISQCIPAFPGAPYLAGARVHIPPNQAQRVEAVVIVRFRNTTDCVGGSIVGEGGSAVLAAEGNWRPLISDRLVAPAEARGVEIALGVRRVSDGGVGEVLFDDAYLKPVLGDCVPSAFTACLNDGRFAVNVGWRSTQGGAGSGRVTPLTPDGTAFWFFDSSNQELLVKVVDGCAINQHFWVFAAATTDVQFDLFVTDTTTGVSKTYRNPQGVAAPATTDTTAFAACG